MLEGPDGRHSKFQRVAVRVAEIDRRPLPVEGNFSLDLDAALLKLLSPSAQLTRFHAERNVAWPDGAVGWKNSFLPCYVSAEKQQDAGSDEKGGTTAPFKFFREFKP